ncbi:uncharacterized protein LOC111242696 [Vigna radiata var. radiata]|uniref:Uncharacterized protein LOC111242696 n=1 Tax=Vigna radiata var. radiata TaxID=3916 RepID=A0A3Q0FGU4_VIGRR|nr:uncharacterized protein LOC111242696 [Vigna radiata var. radiata]
MDHMFRRNKKAFRKGELETDQPPPRLSPSQVWRRVKHFPKVSESGINRIEGFGEWHNWTKRGIFWDLPYWKDNLLRHNLDVMHIAKNFFDDIFNTIMNVSGKKRDNENARKDLSLYCARRDLELKAQHNGRLVKPKANFTISKDEARIICQWTKLLKMADGYSSNLAICANIDKSLIAFIFNSSFLVAMQVPEGSSSGIIHPEFPQWFRYQPSQERVLRGLIRERLQKKPRKQLQYVIKVPDTPPLAYGSTQANVRSSHPPRPTPQPTHSTIPTPSRTQRRTSPTIQLTPSIVPSTPNPIVDSTPIIDPSPSIPRTSSSIPSANVQQPSDDPDDVNDPFPNNWPSIEPYEKGQQSWDMLFMLMRCLHKLIFGREHGHMLMSGFARQLKIFLLGSHRPERIWDVLLMLPQEQMQMRTSLRPSAGLM